MNMGSVQILKLPRDYRGDFLEDYRRFVGKRLAHVPKLKMKVVDDIIGLPNLIPYDDFDLDYHVRRTRVKSEDERELFRKLGRLQHRAFDPNKPLFMFYVIEGLKDGRVAILQKFHHALADGKTAVRIMTLFTDGGMKSRDDADVKRLDQSPGKLRRWVSGGLEDFRRTATSMPGILSLAGRMLGADGRRMVGRLSTRPVTIFSQRLSRHRLFAFRQWPLESLTKVRRALGLTFNEIGLTILSGALRRYLDERDALPDESLICNVPVATQLDGDSGNAVLAMWVPLGTHEAERSDRVKLIKTEVNRAKKLLTDVQQVTRSGKSVRLPSFAMRWIGLSMGSSLVSRFNPPPGNVAMSSVPMPVGKVSVLGAEVESNFGMPMIMHGQAISIAYSTYQDSVVMSLLCCEEALPDPDRLLAYMEEELDDMLANLIKTRPKRQKPKTPPKKRKRKRKAARAS